MIIAIDNKSFTPKVQEADLKWSQSYPSTDEERTTRVQWDDSKNTQAVIPGKDDKEERAARIYGGSWGAWVAMQDENDNTVEALRSERLGAAEFKAVLLHHDVKSHFEDDNLTLAVAVYPAETATSEISDEMDWCYTPDEPTTPVYYLKTGAASTKRRRLDQPAAAEKETIESHNVSSEQEEETAAPAVVEPEEIVAPSVVAPEEAALPTVVEPEEEIVVAPTDAPTFLWSRKRLWRSSPKSSHYNSGFEQWICQDGSHVIEETKSLPHHGGGRRSGD